MSDMRERLRDLQETRNRIERVMSGLRPDKEQLPGTHKEWEAAMGDLARLHAGIGDLFRLTKTDEEPTWYVHKMETQRVYGGPEEGGWWYTQHTPVDEPEEEQVGWPTEELAYEYARILNDQEQMRREHGKMRPIHSVLAYQDTYYTYVVQDSAEPTPEPQNRPHYE